jgi:hypothetical protein
MEYILNTCSILTSFKKERQCLEPASRHYGGEGWRATTFQGRKSDGLPSAAQHRWRVFGVCRGFSSMAPTTDLLQEPWAHGPVRKGTHLELVGLVEGEVKDGVHDGEIVVLASRKP